jgi:hypothetical protein
VIRRRGALVAAAAVGLTACGGARPEAAITGTWRVVAIESRDGVAAPWRRPFGDAPTGLVTYGADGTHTMQFTRTPAPTFAAGDDRGGTDAEVRTAFLAFFAWHGRWRLDATRRRIIHEIEGSLWPSWRGTVQERPYRLRGDTLVLGDTTTTRRVFVRVRR